MEQYIKYLIEQYKQAIGTKNIDINSQVFISEFESWIKQRQANGNEYLKLLNYMGLDTFTERETFEIGKGEFDTLVKDFDTTIVTPYLDGIIVPDSTRLINSGFTVHEGIPVFLKNSTSTMTIIEPVYDSNSLTFMTQNPYTQSKIENWEQIHNYGQNSIIVGVYGSIYDKDINSKIQQLQELRNKLYDSYKEEYFVDGDTYSYAIASARNIKILEKKLTR